MNGEQALTAKAKSLHRALDRIADAKKRARDVLADHYPIGATVKWCHGTQTRRGRVKGHSTFGDPGLRVVGLATGAEYWIDPHRIIE